MSPSDSFFDSRLMLQTIEERLVGKLTDYERSILRHGAAWFFLVLFSYYVLRPIREQIGSTYGIQNLSWLFWTTFAVMLIAIPAYSILVGKYHRRVLVPCIYAIFIGCLIAFWVTMNRMHDRYQIWVARAFFVWISVYGLFVVSFFWSVAGDMLSTSQGRRIFGVIAGGGTIGSMVGSQVAARLVERVGVANLLLIPAVLLVMALLIYMSMEKSFQKHEKSGPNNDVNVGEATGGNPFAGFTAVFKSTYLFSICLFGVFLATCGTAVYFQQAEIVKATFQDAGFDASQIQNAAQFSPDELEAEKAKLQEAAAREARTRYFANVNFAVSIVTLFFQFVVVGWLMKHAGLGVTLSLLPVAYVIGITALAMSPTIAVLAVVSVLGRSAEYGICNPAREVLFTAVKREDRYKAKSFIDTVVRRGGDSAVGGVYRFARDPIGLAMTTLSWLMIPVAIAWIGLSLFIGKENRKIVASQLPKDEVGSL